MVVLLDSSVLIALTTPEHQFHNLAAAWMARGSAFATTPITQGAVLRFLIRYGARSDDAVAVLSSIVALDRHEFWADELPYDSAMLKHVTGHAQVTDAYLLALAQAHHGRIATFDRALAAVRPEVVELLVGEP